MINESSNESEFDLVLNSSLVKHGFAVKKSTEDGLILVIFNGTEMTINPDNIRRDFLRSGQKSLIEAWVASIAKLEEAPDDWQSAKSAVMFSAEGADIFVGDSLYDKISKEIHRILVWVAPDENTACWITPQHLKRWGVSKEEAFEQAAQNMDDLMKETEIQLLQKDDDTLAVLATHSIFKASLALTDAFRKDMTEKLGSPVYVVIPCRDFLYATANKGLLSRLGPVVLREFSESGYPITTEVLMMSEEGIKAIGKFG